MFKSFEKFFRYLFWANVFQNIWRRSVVFKNIYLVNYNLASLLIFFLHGFRENITLASQRFKINKYILLLYLSILLHTKEFSMCNSLCKFRYNLFYFIFKPFICTGMEIIEWLHIGNLMFTICCFSFCSSDLIFTKTNEICFLICSFIYIESDLILIITSQKKFLIIS